MLAVYLCVAPRTNREQMRKVSLKGITNTEMQQAHLFFF